MLVGKGRLLIPKDAHRVESDRWMRLPAGTEFGIYLIGDYLEYEFELHEGFTFGSGRSSAHT
ncbi:MAG: hypothetical protein GX493_00415 [Firmicutes bacterium]|nr:hypothetical protein [Bacillota bacterium]